MIYTQIMKLKEASLPFNQSYDALRSQIRKALMLQLGVVDSYYSRGPYILDVFPGSVVYGYGNDTFRCKYTATYGAAGTDPTVTLGTPSKVHVAYVDSKTTESERVMLNLGEESGSMNEIKQVHESVSFQIKEGSKTTPLPTIPVKIISPGWGSSAYYSEEVIKAAIEAGIWDAGQHMYWNHATDSQEAERPEGDLNNLAAVMVSKASWKDDGPLGAGAYTNCKVFSDYSQQVLEKGAYIGASINAAITGKMGEAEGKKGLIAESFVKAYSTDFVTKAGAGGAPIVPVIESQRGVTPQKEENSMDEKALEALRTENESLKAENAGFKQRLVAIEASANLTLAKATVGAVLKEAGIRFKESLLDRICVNPVMKEGKIDDAWVEGIVSDFTAEEKGAVREMGTRESSRETADDKKTKDRMRESLKRLGTPEKGLDVAVGV